MILFILIFFAMVIVVGVSAVVGFSFFLKRRTKQLQSNRAKQFTGDAPPFRSLFEPTDAEIRAAEREEQAKKEVERRAADERDALEKAEKLGEFEKIWRSEPSKSNTVEFLRRGAASENAAVFSQTAENVIQVWRENKIENLTSTDVADLLDSHLRTLPQQERISGALFWVKREIEHLRRKSE